MLFIATCTDKPERLPLRQETRPAHLAYLEALGGKVRAGGALLTADQKTVIGSLLILEAETEAEARDWLAADPYAKAGLFANVDVKPWRQAAGVIKLA